MLKTLSYVRINTMVRHCWERILFGVFVVILTYGSLLGEGTPGAGQSPVLSPGEMYQDMFPLTRDNFTDKVLRSKDAWIVVFHDGTIDKAWKSLAVHVRGLCWVGLIDVKKSGEWLGDINYDAVKDVARVYPHGGKHVKKQFTRVTTQNEAQSIALKSIPDKTLKISGSDVKDLLIDCYMSKPSKFPAYFIADEEEPAALFKALSNRFEKYFIFGRVVKPTQADLTNLGLGTSYITIPALYVIITDMDNPENMNAIQYDANILGSMNYTNVMQFLFSVNSQFRHTLPGDNQSGEKQEAEMEDIIKVEEERFTILFAGQNRSTQKEKSDDKPSTKDNGFKITSHSNTKDEF